MQLSGPNSYETYRVHGKIEIKNVGARRDEAFLIFDFFVDTKAR